MRLRFTSSHLLPIYMQGFSEVVPAGPGSAQPVKPFCLLGAALCGQSQQHQLVCLDTDFSGACGFDDKCLCSSYQYLESQKADGHILLAKVGAAQAMREATFPEGVSAEGCRAGKSWI